MRQIQLIKPHITLCTIASFAILILLGCTTEDPPPIQTRMPEAAPVSTLRPSATETPVINPETPAPGSTIATIPSTSTTFPSLSPTSFPTLVPTPELTCPPLTEIDSEIQSLVKSGSILLQPFGESRVLAISGNETEPYTINAPLEWPYLAELSPDKTKLLFWRHGETIIIYDLLSKEENHISWQESWPSIRGWSVNERIKFVLSFEEIEGQGLYPKLFYSIR